MTSGIVAKFSLGIETVNLHTVVTTQPRLTIQKCGFVMLLYLFQIDLLVALLRINSHEITFSWRTGESAGNQGSIFTDLSS